MTRSARRALEHDWSIARHAFPLNAHAPSAALGVIRALFTATSASDGLSMPRRRIRVHVRSFRGGLLARLIGQVFPAAR